MPSFSKLQARAQRGICFFPPLSPLRTLCPWVISFLAFSAPPLTAQNDVARPKITGVAYVRLYAADLPKAREFYRTILGIGGDTSDCLGAGAFFFSVKRPPSAWELALLVSR